MAEEKEKMVSKTGMTGVIQVLIGAALAAFPTVFKDLSPEQVAQGIGAFMSLSGILVTVFRNLSTGNKPKYF